MVEYASFVRGSAIRNGTKVKRFLRSSLRHDGALESSHRGLRGGPYLDMAPQMPYAFTGMSPSFRDHNHYEFGPTPATNLEGGPSRFLHCPQLSVHQDATEHDPTGQANSGPGG